MKKKYIFWGVSAFLSTVLVSSVLSFAWGWQIAYGGRYADKVQDAVYTYIKISKLPVVSDDILATLKDDVSCAVELYWAVNKGKSFDELPEGLIEHFEFAQSIAPERCPLFIPSDIK